MDPPAPPGPASIPTPARRTRVGGNHLHVETPAGSPAASIPWQSTRSHILDAASWFLVLLGLALALRLESDYGTWPLLGLVLPALRGLVSRNYRDRLRQAARTACSRIAAFSRAGGPLPIVPVLALVVAPAFGLNMLDGAILGAVDTHPVVPTAISLTREGNWDISEFARSRPRSLLHGRDGQLRACFQELDGRIYSAFPPGMVPWALAVAEPARILGADFDRPVTHLRLEKTTAALVAAVALGLFFLVSSTLGDAAAAAVMTGLLATGSAVFTTVGLGLWQHGGVVVWLLVALLVEFRSEGRPSARATIVQGLALGQMLSCRPTAALLVGLFGVWVLCRAPRRAFALGALAALSFLPWALLYQTLYHQPFGPHTIAMNTGRQYWNFFRARTIAGVLVSPSRGLFVYQPWAVLALATLSSRCSARERDTIGRGPTGWIGYAAVTGVLHIWLIAAWHDWSGGWCWGSRLLTDVIPLVGLLAVPTISRLLRVRGGSILLAAIALMGLSVHLPCVLRDAARWNAVTDHDRDLWSWPNAPFLYEGRAGR